jgi:3-oxoacyl-[acyl-carrier-protein] synthase II
VRRVAVTGIGVVSPLGNDPHAFFDQLARGRSGIRRLSVRFDERLPNRIGAPAFFDAAVAISGPQARMLDRVSQFALAAAAQAVRDSGAVFGDKRRCGVFLGTGMGGAETADDGYYALYGEGSDRVRPYTMNNAPAAWIGIEYGLSGPNLTYSTACSSSAVAIGEAGRRIASGEVDVMLAGGAEAPLSFGTLKAWDALKTLAVEDPRDPAASCKPFARDRTGLVLGEGAAIVVLESWEHALARDARIHGELLGYGLRTDPAHITRPTAEGQADAMTRALQDAGLEPADVDYVNAHGTGTPANDAVETAAIRKVFGPDADRIPVSSTKSMHGHLLGAAGALEFVVAMLAAQQRIVPPTINLHVPDPECDLDYVPNRARTGADLRVAMTNSFAFGGTNAVLILGSAERNRR